MGEVTRLLSAIDEGEPRAAEQLLPLVYQELRKLAASRLAQERPGQTLQATALVHEAYLRLVRKQEPGIRDQEPVPPGSRPLVSGPWHSRGHFFAAAAEAMRRILIDQARRKGRDKRGGGFRRVELDPADVPITEDSAGVLAIDEALTKLASEDPRAAELVKLRFFAGLPLAEAADALGISRTTAYDDWAYARAWLRCELDEGAGDPAA